MLKISNNYLFFLFFLLIGCFNNSGKDISYKIDVSSEYHQGFKNDGRINEVLILPVFTRESKQTGEILRSNTLYSPDYVLTNKLTRILQIYTSLNVLNPEEVNANNVTEMLGLKIQQTGLTQEAIYKLAKKVQAQTGATHVMFSQVDLIGNRTGGSLGSERSAKINYRIWLFSGNLKEVVWSSAYKSKEETLSENLFMIKKKIKSGLGFSNLYDLINEAFKGSARKLNAAIKLKNSGKNLKTKSK